MGGEMVNYNGIRIQFLGDISLNGLFCDPLYHNLLRTNMQEIACQLSDCDLRICNFESPLWGNGEVNKNKNPRLATTLLAAECLKPLRINVALLANNHVYDCGFTGFNNTVKYFQDNRIKYLGAGTSVQEAQKYLIVEIGKTKIGLLNYVDAKTYPQIPVDAPVCINELRVPDIFEEAEELIAIVDYVICNIHWGIEYTKYPMPQQRTIARKLVEGGVAIVACHHPHCMQGHEQWEKGHIFYSMGNFIFGGMHGRECMPLSKLSRKVAVAECILADNMVKDIKMHFYLQNNLFLEKANDQKRQNELSKMSRKLSLPDKKYKRAYRREIVFQFLFGYPLRFIHTSGGIFKAIRRVRFVHILIVIKHILGKQLR